MAAQKVSESMTFSQWENNFSKNSAWKFFSIHQKARTGYKALFIATIL